MIDEQGDPFYGYNPLAPVAEMIEAVAEVGSGVGVGLVLVGLTNAVLLIDKYLVTLLYTTVPHRHMTLSHTLLSAVPGPLGLAPVAVST